MTPGALLAVVVEQPLAEVLQVHSRREIGAWLNEPKNTSRCAQVAAVHESGVDAVDGSSTGT
jgi:hypothetical protein